MTSPSDREIVSTRLVPAPRALVFRAWTEPQHLAQWWGPDGFTNTFEEFDLRSGGHWRFIMHGPDGKNYPNHSVFTEITPLERIVFEYQSPPAFQVTATFAEVGDQTQITFRMLFADAATCDRVKVYAIPANEQNFNRLETELKKMV
jgi:uncharacterized protein YndB with AHSA1/START domain